MLHRVKYVVLTAAGLVLIAALAIYLVRLPSYSIELNGQLYVVNKLSREIQVIDLMTGKEIASIPTAIESHEALATRNGKAVLVTSYGAQDSKGNIIKVINTDTHKIERTIRIKGNLRANGIINLEQPDRIILVDYARNNLTVFNIESDSVERIFPTNQKNSHLAVLHPFKPLVYVTNMSSNSVSVIHLDSGELITTIPCGLVTESIAITPDGSEVWTTNKDGNTISVIDTGSNKVIATIPTGREPLKLNFSVDGQYCMVANAGDGNISVVDQKSKKQIKTISIPGKSGIIERILFHTPRPVNILMHPDGRYAFVSNSNARKIEVIDMNTLEIVGNIGTGMVPDALVFLEKRQPWKLSKKEGKTK